MKQFLLAAELRRTNAAGILDLTPFPDILYDKYVADYNSDDSSDSGGAEINSPISLKHTEFSLKQIAKRMGQHNFCAFNKWKKLWVAEFLEKEVLSIIRRQNRLKQLRDGPLHWKTAVADFVETFETRLPLENFNNAEWIW
jgi:hypothetical protein